MRYPFRFLASILLAIAIGAPIAMAWVSTPHSAIDTALEIEVRGKRIAAAVAPMPFVPHRYRRKP